MRSQNSILRNQFKLILLEDMLNLIRIHPSNTADPTTTS